MSPEENKYYDNYFDLFATDGWKQFIEEINDILDKHRIEDIKNEQHLAFIKGERAAPWRHMSFSIWVSNNETLG